MYSASGVSPIFEGDRVLYDGKRAKNDLLLALLRIFSTPNLDSGICYQAGELIKLVLENDQIVDLVNEDFDEFVRFFYDKYVPWIAAPFHGGKLVNISEKNGGVRGKKRSHSQLSDGREDGSEIVRDFDGDGVGEKNGGEKNGVSAAALHVSLELMCFATKVQAFKMKNFILNNNVFKYVFKLLHVGSGYSSHLKLSALRFLKTTIATKDDAYSRYLISQNMFSAIFNLLKANFKKDNITMSSILEVFDLLVQTNRKLIISSLVDERQIVPKFLEEHKDEIGESERNALEKVISRNNENKQEKKNNDAIGASNQAAEEDLEKRKFRERMEEESYFDDDDDDDDEDNCHVNDNELLITAEGNIDLEKIGDRANKLAMRISNGAGAHIGIADDPIEFVRASSPPLNTHSKRSEEDSSLRAAGKASESAAASALGALDDYDSD